MVSGSREWSPTLPTVAVLMRAYRNPLSSFFRAIEDGDDCLESLSYDSPSFREEIVYERRAMLDTMADIWRERNNSNKCRAEIRKKLGVDNVRVNSWFSQKNPTLTVYIFRRIPPLPCIYSHHAARRLSLGCPRCLRNTRGDAGRGWIIDDDGKTSSYISLISIWMIHSSDTSSAD